MKGGDGKEVTDFFDNHSEKDNLNNSFLQKQKIYLQKILNFFFWFLQNFSIVRLFITKVALKLPFLD